MARSDDPCADLAGRFAPEDAALLCPPPLSPEETSMNACHHVPTRQKGKKKGGVTRNSGPTASFS
jgi:hypothetical protein